MIALLAVTLSHGSGAAGLPPETIALRERGSPRGFGEGVRIDWQQGVVEVQATVVLRQGLLELVACSPNTKEHESILRVAARPRDIFRAMGLVGLTPGKPVRYDAATNEWLPPSGPSLRIDVRYRDRGDERTVPIEQWLLLPDETLLSDSLPWIFAGSQTSPEGTFGADAEGTVLCVVDFPTALIGVGALHSSSNDELWLAANTALIPPLGTSCTLMIARAGPRPIIIDVLANGDLLEGARPVSASFVVKAAGRKECDQVEGGVVLQAAKEVPDQALNAAIKALVDGGLRRETIRVLRPANADNQ